MSYATACAPGTPRQVEAIHSRLSELSDDGLMARIRHHDQEAFACLLARHLNPVHAYLYRLTGSRADADDLSQDTFLRVWRKAASFKPGRVKLTTWLHRVAHNLCVDDFRKRRTHAVVSLDEPPAGFEEEAVHPAIQDADCENLELVNIALMRLPESQRSALVLCQIQGFSNHEGAEILGISVSALESLLARARRRLKNELPEHLRNE
ncbi:MAG: sigma-70 family RNA polymerase sigma factor [Gammaproteobacteria bacterium]|nr:sigma-70 family RNA polymerase sigma factor [Gammaproteobacteria bacterium]